VCDEKQLKQIEGFIDKFLAQMVWRACLHERCVVISTSSANVGILGWQPVSTSSQENNTQR